MTYSIIKKTQLEGALRLDAEFYQAEYFIDFSKGKWTTIGENFNCQYGLSLAMNDKRIGYLMYKMDDISDGFLVNNEVKFAKTSEQEHRLYKLKANDVLFNRVNSEEFVGRTGIFKDSTDGVFASYLIRLTPNSKSQILSDYLNIFLNSKYGQEQIKKYSRRAVNQANVNAEELKLFKIALLSPYDQKEIQQLSEESWKELINSKENYKKAEELLLEKLELKDFEKRNDLFSIVKLSDTQKANRIDAEYYQPKFYNLISRIKKFNNNKLKNVIEIVPAEFNPNNQSEKEYKYVELANINSSIGTIEGYSNVLGKEAPSRAKRLLKENDIIVSSVEGSLEKVALADEEQDGYIASTGFFQFRSKAILPEVLLVMAKSIIFQCQLLQRCSGTILTAVSEKSINDMIVPILPKPIQQKIADLVIKSHRARQKSKSLLVEAKRKIEEMIEKGR